MKSRVTNRTISLVANALSHVLAAIVTIYAARVLGPGELLLFATVQIVLVLCVSISGKGRRLWNNHWRAVSLIGLSIISGALILYFNPSIERVLSASGPDIAVVGLVTIAACLFHLGAALWEWASYAIYCRLALHHADGGRSAIVERVVADILPGGVWMSSAVHGVLFLVAPVVIPAVLPRYSECIPAAQVLVLALNLFGAGPLFAWTLAFVGRQHFPVSLRGARLALRAAALLIALAISPTPLSLAIGTVAGQLLYATVTALNWHAITGFDLKPAGHSLVGSICISAVAIGCAFTSPPGEPSAANAAVVTYLALLIGLTLIVEHKGRTISRFWSLAIA